LTGGWLVGEPLHMVDAQCEVSESCSDVGFCLAW
jgi:hypothetical protein